MDKILRSTGKVVELRFVLVDVAETANAIAKLHQLDEVSLKIVAESIVVGCLMSSTMKHPGVLQLNLRFQKPVITIQTDVTPAGLVRSRCFTDKSNTNLSSPIMSITRRNEKGDKMQESIIKMPSTDMELVLRQYQFNSEQTRAICRLESIWKDSRKKSLKHCVGVLIEAFPKASNVLLEDTKTWFQKISFFENDKTSFSLENLLRKISDPYAFQIHKEIPVQHYCPCTKEKFVKNILNLGKKELKSFLVKKEPIQIKCEFCVQNYTVSLHELEALVNQFQ